MFASSDFTTAIQKETLNLLYYYTKKLERMFSKKKKTGKNINLFQKAHIIDSLIRWIHASDPDQTGHVALKRIIIICPI